MKFKLISGKDMLIMLSCAGDVVKIKADKKFLLIDTGFGNLFLNEDCDKKLGNPEHHVVIVNKNSDFTSGYGPMVFHKVFRDIENAIQYIMKQDGIYGSKQGISNWPGVNINGEPHVVSGFNGYDIKIVRLED